MGLATAGWRTARRVQRAPTGTGTTSGKTYAQVADSLILAGIGRAARNLFLMLNDTQNGTLCAPTPAHLYIVTPCVIYDIQHVGFVLSRKIPVGGK
jgi:hypothetical protein